eukprot:Pgem_evm1s4229
MPSVLLVLIAKIRCFVTWIFTQYVFTFFNWKAEVRDDEKIVVITGCDSGFGRDLALRLDKQGVM